MVTGAAGFIGMHVCQKFLDLGYAVTGIDNLNSYYDVILKEARINILSKRNGFRFERSEIAEAQAVSEIFTNPKPNILGSMAARILKICYMNNITELGKAFIKRKLLMRLALFVYSFGLKKPSCVFFQSLSLKKLEQEIRDFHDKYSSRVNGRRRDFDQRPDFAAIWLCRKLGTY
ncbi:MAG: GDP-mannose 4,6-dehydratase [Parvibaculales bacterium]